MHPISGCLYFLKLSLFICTHKVFKSTASSAMRIYFSYLYSKLMAHEKIQNAKHALDDKGRSMPSITVRLGASVRGVSTLSKSIGEVR